MEGAPDHETEELFQRCRESTRRSRDRRRPQRDRRTRALLCAGVAALTTLATALAFSRADTRDDLATQPSIPSAAALDDLATQPSIPSAAALDLSWSYARARGGDVSLAVIDTAGRLRGRKAGKRYVSASVVKAMLLVAEVRRLERERLSIDPATERLLKAMITYSDNAAADAIYLRVGDSGLFEVARLAGMRRFTVADYWATAQITAADMARLFSRLSRLLAGPYRAQTFRLFGSVVEDQRWGIPKAASGNWAVFFKGGWRATETGQLVHQVALLRRGGRELVIAVLTDGQPSRRHAIQTLRGIAARLLRPE